MGWGQEATFKETDLNTLDPNRCCTAVSRVCKIYDLNAICSRRCKFRKIKGWTIRVLGFDSRRGLGIFLFTTASRTSLGPTKPPNQWVPRTLSLGVKRPWREADHSPPPSAEVKECVELLLHSPNTPSWRGAQLKHRDNFTSTFTF
jgi:hypothetical protein